MSDDPLYVLMHSPRIRISTGVRESNLHETPRNQGALTRVICHDGTNPYSGPLGAAVVWTGSEMVVWAARVDPHGAADGAAYVPAADPCAPSQALEGEPHECRTGSEMIVFGALMDTTMPRTPITHRELRTIPRLTGLRFWLRR